MTPAGLALLECDGVLTLDHVRVGNRLFIPDTPENQARMATLQQRRDDRAARARERRRSCSKLLPLP